MEESENKPRLNRVPLECGVVRHRDKWSRFEYPEDRMQFWRWRKAVGPCSKPYWTYNEEKRTLTIELKKGERVMCYCISHLEMDHSKFGWRWIVAQSVSKVRRALTPNVEVRDRPLLGDPS